MPEQVSLIERLRDACNGQSAKIPWPHRLLHEAADALELVQLRHGAGSGPRCPKCGSGRLSHYLPKAEVECQSCNQTWNCVLVADFAQFFPSRNQWISISKQPNIGQWVHVIINGVVQKMPCALDLHGWGEEHGKTWRWLDETAPHAPFEAVSHWQALPEAP